VIFITAHHDHAEREEAMRLGAKCFLTMPFSGRALIHALTRAIDEMASSD